MFTPALRHVLTVICAVGSLELAPGCSKPSRLAESTPKKTNDPLPVVTTATPIQALLPASVQTVEYAVPTGRAAGSGLMLDLYLPARAADAPPPALVVWFHGGGWVGGSRTPSPGSFLVAAGFAVASVDYRLSSEAIFPAQIHDGKAAIRYLRSHAAQLGIDGKNIGAWGQSAGGHMASLLGTSANVRELEGDLGNAETSSSVQAVGNFCGLIDLTTVKRANGVLGLAGTDAPDSVESRFVGGPVQNRREACKIANPATYVDGSDPPFLHMHGDADVLVPMSQTREFDRLLRAAGVESEVIVVPGGEHVFGGTEVERAVLSFFRRTLLGPRPAAQQ